MLNVKSEGLKRLSSRFSRISSMLQLCLEVSIGLRYDDYENNFLYFGDNYEKNL